MASSKEVSSFPSKQYEIFILDDNSNSRILREIKSIFDEANITYCDCDGEAGKSVFDSIEELQSQSRKTLIVVSTQLRHGTKHRIETVINNDSTSAIALFATDCYKRLMCLSTTPTIHQSSCDWREKLVNQVREKIPDFCEVICTAKNPGNFCLSLCNLYDVQIDFGDKHVLVDLEKLVEHYDTLHQFNIPSVCGSCDGIRNVDTRVRVKFPAEKKFENRDKLRLQQYIPELISQVLDVKELTKTKDFRSLVVTLNGIVKSNQQKYVRDFHQTSMDKVRNVWQKEFKQPLFSDYKEEEKRVDTFAGNWDESIYPPAQQMAAAGYICVKRNTARCYSCGNGYLGYNKDKDPLIGHAYFKQCEFIAKMNLQEDEIDTYQDIDKFKDISERQKSFADFDFAMLECDSDYSESDSYSLTSNTKLIKDMVDSGYYFTGVNNYIKCFECRTGIFYRNRNESPWDLHAISSPSCHYLRSNAPPQLIRSVSSRRKEDPVTVTYFLLSHAQKSTTSDTEYTFTYT